MNQKYLTLIFALFLLFAPKAEARGIQFVGGASAVGTASTYTVSLTSLRGGIDTAAREGDLVMVLMGVMGTTDLNLNVTGYAEIADVYKNDTWDTNFYAGYKFMTATPDTSITATGSGSAANGGATRVLVWRGVDRSTPLDVASTTFTCAANTHYVDTAAATPATSGAIVMSAGLGSADSSPTAYTMPSGMEFATTTIGVGSTASAVLGSAVWYMHELAAYDPAIWTGGDADTNSDSCAGSTITLRPESPNSPLYQAAGTAVAATTGAFAVAWPTHAVDDVGLLFVESQADEATLSTANGFVKLGTTVSATGTRLDVFWARATSTTMGSPTVAANSDHAYGIILTFRNVFKNGDPFSAWSSDVKNAASVTDTLPTLRTDEEGQLIVLAATSEVDSASAFTSAIVNNSIRGITERTDAGTANGNGGAITVATALEESATSTINTTAFTVTSSASAMMTIALKGVGYDTTSTSASRDAIKFNGGRWRFWGGRMLFR